MSLVVVYLIGAREFVAVPDNWVLDLNTAKLKNNGRNSNQEFLVYCAFADGKPIFKKQPNFQARVSRAYNPNIDEACFLCRIKKFFGECRSNLPIFTMILSKISIKDCALKIYVYIFLYL